MGPMTGWGRGICGSRVGAPAAAYGWGSGFGRAGGFGRGFRRGGAGFGWGSGFGRRGVPPAAGWGWNVPDPAWDPAAGSYGMNPEDEAGYLKQEAEAVRRELDAIQRRINELETRDSSS